MIISKLFLILTRAQQTNEVFLFFELDQLLSGVLQILKKNNDAFCIISELNLQKTAKF